jgi:selenium-binding protein 1
MKGQREKFLFLTCPNYNIPLPDLTMKMPASLQPKKADAVFSVDVDPASPTYCQFVSKVEMPKIGDEIHHCGWNTCGGCFGMPGMCRRYLICPTLMTSRIYVIDTDNPCDLKLHKIIKHKELEMLNATFLHTTHCLPNGNIMISALGDNKFDNLGHFIELDKDFNVLGKWNSEQNNTEFGYAFWYQPRLNVMISTGWASPNAVKHGFRKEHMDKGLYGKSLYIWNYSARTITQKITLDGEEGWMPFEVRFLHEPTEPHAYVGTAYGSAIYHIYKDEGEDLWKCQMVEVIPKRKVSDWVMDEMPGLLTDNIISMDDRFLYISLWLHGEIRQYNIEDRFNPKLVGKVIVGGLLHKVKVEDPDFTDYAPTVVMGKTIHGGPHALQLSLDGKRLYVTTAINTPWDEQFYPDMVKEGASVLKIDVNTEQGGLTIDPNFLIDMGTAPGGRYGVHQVRYPGGDCTSDIWV